MTNIPSDETIILHLLRGAVPERADELTQLWREHRHEIMIAPNTTGSKMDATSTRITFNAKTIDFFWLCGFNAWRAVEVYIPTFMLAVLGGSSLDSILSQDEELRHFEQDYKNRLEVVQALLDAEDTSQIDWPDDIPTPTAERENLASLQEMAVFDLVALAVAFAFLHEFKHVQARAEEKKIRIEEHDKQKADEEEIACDTWARNFMTANIAKYAGQHSHSHQQVEQKRAMGIALAAIIIHTMTPQSVRWGNDDYPPIKQRFQALLGGYNLPDDSPFWFLTGCLLISLMRQDGRPLNYNETTFRGLVMKLLSEMQ